MFYVLTFRFVRCFYTRGLLKSSVKHFGKQAERREGKSVSLFIKKRQSKQIFIWLAQGGTRVVSLASATPKSKSYRQENSKCSFQYISTWTHPTRFGHNPRNLIPSERSDTWHPIVFINLMAPGPERVSNTPDRHLMKVTQSKQRAALAHSTLPVNSLCWQTQLVSAWHKVWGGRRCMWIGLLEMVESTEGGTLGSVHPIYCIQMVIGGA